MEKEQEDRIKGIVLTAQKSFNLGLIEAMEMLIIKLEEQNNNPELILFGVKLFLKSQRLECER
jgi:hypothetical protein